jgi:ATP-dependent helicase/DNAse subunit B
MLIETALGCGPKGSLIIVPYPIVASEIRGRLPPGFPIITLQTLCRQILRDSPYRPISSAEAIGYLRSLLASDTLSLESGYDRVRMKPAFARELLELIELLKLNGFEMRRLLELSGESAKARDLVAIAEAFHDALEAEGCFLEADLPRRVLDNLSSDFPLARGLFVDKLERFSYMEYELIRKMGDGGEMTVTVDELMDVSRLADRFTRDFHPEIIHLTDQHRLNPVTSILIERAMSGGVKPVEKAAVLMWERTVFDEIEAVAMKILSLMDNGVNPDDMAIIVRDMDSMWRGIHDLLDGYRIPHLRAGLEEGEGVKVMSAERTAGEFEVVFVMELASERFPKRYPSRQILHGEDMRPVRAALKPYGIPGAMSAEDWYGHEKLLLYSALSRCKEKLFLSFAEDYVANLDCRPSPFLVEIVGDEEIDEGGCSEAGLKLERYWISSRDGLRSTVAMTSSLNEAIFADGRLASLPEPLPEVKISGVGERRFSHTSIRGYLLCPRRFFFEELLDLPSEKPSRVKFGRIIHDRLRELHGAFPEIDDATSEALLSYVLDGIERAFDPSQFDSELEMRGYMRLARAVLEEYVRWVHEAWHEGRRTILCERGFELEMEGFKLRGKVDRVDLLPDGGHEIIDYKVSSSSLGVEALKRRFVNVKDDPEYRAEDYQLPIYYFAVTESLGLKVAALTFLHLLNLTERSSPEKKLEITDENGDKRKGAITQEELLSARADIVATLKEISSGIYPPEPKDEITCGRCPFSFICSRK